MQYNRNHGAKKLTPDETYPTRVFTQIDVEKYLVKYKWIGAQVKGTETHNIEMVLHPPSDELCDKCLIEQKSKKEKYCGEDCVGFVKVPCDKVYKILL